MGLGHLVLLSYSVEERDRTHDHFAQVALAMLTIKLRFLVLVDLLIFMFVFY